MTDKRERVERDETAAKNAGTQPMRHDVLEQRGGEQSDQRVGQTEKGAHNQEMKGRNPQGNKTDRNSDEQSDRMEAVE